MNNSTALQAGAAGHNPKSEHAAARSVARVIQAQSTLEGGGFPVRRPFPIAGFGHFDPFLLIDHLGPVSWQPGAALGAPDHPHRGFETVTYVLAGENEHRDSFGNADVLRPGDVQAPRLAVTRWPPPALTDGTWKGRLRLRGEQLPVAWEAFLGPLLWEAFVSLTFDPKRRFPVSRDHASREAFLWCGQAAYSLRRPLAWVYATERHASGAWHAHVLVAGASCAELKAARMLWEARNGHAEIKRVTDPGGAVRYLSKFAAREGEIVFSDTLAKYRHLLSGK